MNYKQLTDQARDFAITSHGDQKYGIHPYEIHLGNVVTALMRFGVTPTDEYQTDLLRSAWLHDVIEDTEVTREELAEKFGEKVAVIVYALSDEKGNSREERKINFYLKISGSEEAIIVKLADRISNVEFSLIHGNDRKYDVYKTEQKKFEEAITGVIQTQLGLDLLAYLRRLLA